MHLLNVRLESEVNPARDASFLALAAILSLKSFHLDNRT